MKIFIITLRSIIYCILIHRVQNCLIYSVYKGTTLKTDLIVLDNKINMKVGKDVVDIVYQLYLHYNNCFV